MPLIIALLVIVGLVLIIANLPAVLAWLVVSGGNLLLGCVVLLAVCFAIFCLTLVPKRSSKKKKLGDVATALGALVVAGLAWWLMGLF